MRKWQILKAVLYLTIAIFIFIFNKSVMLYVGFLVGGVVCLYSLEELAVYAFKRTLLSDPYHLFDGIAQLLIGIILFIVSNDIIKVCLIWGVWAILRESKEMAEAIKKIPVKKSEIINVAESVIVIALSFLMILEPNEAHAYLHVILLGAELVIVVLFYFAEVLSNKISKRNSKESDEKENSEEISI